MTDSTLLRPSAINASTQAIPDVAPSTFDTVKAQMGASLPTNQLNQLLHAYQTGVMKPDDAKQFESDAHSGLIVFPDNIHIGGKPVADASKPIVELPKGAIDAYNKAAANPYDKGAMDYTSRKQLDEDLANGIVKLRSGDALNQTYLGVTGNVKEAITGNLRSTPETKNNPDYTSMPEFSHFSAPAFKASLGTLVTTDPSQIAKVIKTQFPDVAVSQDDKGNFLFKSGEDGHLYVLKPGATIDDVAKGVGMALAFTPAGRAETVVGSAVASGATQAALEGTKAATGGDFNANDVLAAAAIGGAIPGVGKVYSAAKSALGAGEKAVASEAAPVVATTAEKAVGEAPKTAIPAQGGNQVHYGSGESATLKEGGSLAWRNNNEGNIRSGHFADANGAIGSNKGFAVFPTPEAGQAAKENLLFNSSGYKDLNIGQAITRWAPPAENNTAGYIKAITEKTGISPATPLAKLSPEQRTSLLDAMKAHEGWQPGKEIVNGTEAAVASEVKAVTPSTVGSTGLAPKAVQPPLAPTQTAEELAQTTRKAALGGFGSGQATEDLAGQVAPNTETLAAAKRLGVEDYLQPDHVTTNQVYRELTQAVKSIPGSSARAQELEGMAQVAQRADKIISDIGGTHDLSELNENVANKLDGIQTQLENQTSQQYAKLKAAIPAQVPVETNNILNFIKGRADDLGGVQNLSPEEKTIFKKLAPKAVDAEAVLPAEGSSISPAEYKQLQRQIEAAKVGSNEVKQPTYALLDDVRRDIGQALYKKSGPFKDADSGLLNKLYTELSKDQGVVAEAHGVGDLWKAAKLGVAARKGIEDDMTSLFGKNLNQALNTKLSTAVGDLAKGDAAKFENFIKAIPPDMRQRVVASGLATAFGKKLNNGGTISFKTFSDWYEGLMKNKQSFNAIMMNLPSKSRQQLQDLYQVSKGISLASKERITTGRLGSAPNIQVIKNGIQNSENIMDKVYEAATHVGKHAGKIAAVDLMGGHGFGMATAVYSALKGGSTDALKAADDLIASPIFKQTIAQIASGEPRAVKPAIALLSYSKPFLRFSRALGSPREMTNKERWLMQALEADNNNSSTN